MVQLIVLFQIFEWHSLTTLLSWQSDKSEREIWADNQSHSKAESHSYHRAEKRIKKAFTMLGVVCFIFNLVLNVYTFIVKNALAFAIKWGVKIFEIVLLLYFSLRLRHYAKRENPTVYAQQRVYNYAYVLGTILALFCEGSIVFG